MDKDSVSKRAFYLEAALKKTWKEFNRLKKTIVPDESFGNKPFEKLKEDE